MPLKLGIDASRANQKERSGVEKYCYQIIQHLKSSIPAEVQVILYSKSTLDYGLEQLPENWSSKVLKWGGPFWTQIRLSWEMLFRPVDILFIPGHVFPLIHPEKTVLTIHDVAATEFPQAYSLFERLYSLYTPKLAQKCLYKIIVPSQFTKDELIEKFNLSQDKIDVISHGFIDDLHNQAEESVLNNFDVQTPYLLYLGRIESKKNVSRIIKSFDKVKENHSDLQLVLAGKPGYGYEEIKAEIEFSSYRDDILELGWVSKKEKASLLTYAKALVFPSLYEGFGFPVLEALSCETPVVASKDSSLQEVGGDVPYYVNPSSVDSISQAIDKAVSCSGNRVEQGRKRIRKFSWDKAARKTVQVLLS
ncbi:MAG: glycosyltransferase family 4 protein [Candidatus Paceibacteria bacterium]